MILAISCHYYLIACDVYHVYTSYLLRTTVVNKMIPHENFKKVFPLLCTVAKVRCFEAPHDDQV